MAGGLRYIYINHNPGLWGGGLVSSNHVYPGIASVTPTYIIVRPYLARTLCMYVCMYDDGSGGRRDDVHPHPQVVVSLSGIDYPVLLENSDLPTIKHQTYIHSKPSRLRTFSNMYDFTRTTQALGPPIRKRGVPNKRTRIIGEQATIRYLLVDPVRLRT